MATMLPYDRSRSVEIIHPRPSPDDETLSASADLPVVTMPLDEIWVRASKGVAAAAVILNADGRVLLVMHSYGRLNWEIPGGAAEPDETPIETALREVLEETGLTVTADRLTGIYYENYEAGREALHFVFLCRTVDDVAVPRPSCDEITACGYWSADALPRPISDFTVRRIDDAIAVPGPVLPMVITPRQWLP
jgi:8-oxo-dGTP diphosphatase